MAWGFWNKIKKGLSSAGRWFKNKIFKPLGRTIKKVGKPMLNTAVKLAPVIGTAHTHTVCVPYYKAAPYNISHTKIFSRAKYNRVI